jgi:hypothetical protein
VDEAHAAGLDGSHPVTLQAKMLRLELLNVKADLERESWLGFEGNRLGEEASPRANADCASGLPK